MTRALAMTVAVAGLLFADVHRDGTAGHPPRSGDVPVRQGAAVPMHIGRDTPTAFVNVRVVTMRSPDVLDGQTVLVRDGRIVRIGPTGQVAVPEGTRVIPGDGRYLLPGLIDMHVHLLNADHMLLYLANGITTVRNMWGFDEIFSWRDEVAAGKRLGPRIFSASPGLDGSPPSWPGAIVVDDPAIADSVVAAQKARGYDFIKVYTRLKPAPFDAIAAAAHRHGIRFVGHVPLAVPLAEVLAGKPASIEHLGGFAAPVMGRGPGDWSGPFNEARADSVARAVLASGAWVCPTLEVQDMFPLPERAAQLDARPETRYVDPDTRSRWVPVPRGRPEDVRRAFAANRGRMVAALARAGVPLLLGTDAWISYVIPGFSLHDELAMMVEAGGLTPYQALRAGTVDAARFLNATDRFGSIAQGLAADLVLFDANPLEDIHNSTRRAGTMVAGEWLSQAELQKRLDALAAAYAKAPK